MLPGRSMTPPFRTGLEKGNNSISASIPTLPCGAFKGGGKIEGACSFYKSDEYMRIFAIGPE